MGAFGTNIASYADWNGAIELEMLSGQSAGAPFYLYLESDLLTRVAETVGVDGDPRERLCEAVAKSLATQAGVSPFRPHLEATTRWEKKGKIGAPPGLALLAVLTAAAEAMVADGDHAAHNYYDRLAEVLPLPQSQAERVRQHFPETVQLWQALNDWLEDWEGELGLATARVQDRRVYVGFPLSQALVRAHDRRRLQEMFARYGLSPGRRLGASEMETYLDDWLSQGNAPRGLARPWAEPLARRRIALIACAELENWGGAVTARAEAGLGLSPVGRLEWLAEVALEPVPELSLYLVARGNPDEAEGHYRAGARTDAAGAAALAGCGGALRLERLADLGVASLEPWSRLGVSSLLAGAVEITSVDKEGLSFRRWPGPVLVLAHCTRDGRFHEVARAQLLERCLVMAHQEVADRVERHLRTVARPGFRRLAGSALRNLPKDWVAFLDVIVVDAVDDPPTPMLAPLCAAPATVIAFDGGLKLGQNTWHADLPPEVLAAWSRDAPFRLMGYRREPGATERTYSLGVFTHRAAASLASLEDGDYEIRLEGKLTSGGYRVVDSASLRLRTADHPRPAGVRRPPLLGYQLGAGRWLGAQKLPDGPVASGVLIGCQLRMADPVEGVVASAADLTPSTELAAHALDERPGRSGLIEDLQYAQSCAVRGYHHWLCDPAGPDDNFRSLMRQECRDCHKEEWTRNRGVHRRKSAKPAARARPALVGSALPALTRLAGGPRPPLDLLLDALSYIGAGTWDQFRSLSGSLSDNALFPWRAARLLAAVGHVDLEVDRETFRIRAWQIGPPCLVETADGAWVLAGARSAGMVDRLREAVEVNGGVLAETLTNDGLAVVRLTAQSSEVVERLTIGIMTPTGADIALAPCFARRLAGLLSPLSSAAKSLVELRVGAKGLERYDLAAGRWSAAEHDTSGAYRLEFRGRTYGVSSAEDLSRHVMRVTDVFLAKHLAAAEARMSLIGYDARRQVLLVPLGAELPGVLDRLAAMSGGYPPQREAGAPVIEYAGVPPDIAATIQRCLRN